MKKTLVIVRGIPGSGKSTTAEFLADSGIIIDLGDTGFKYPVFAADDFFGTGDNYKWNAKLIGRAHEQCQLNTKTAMRDGVDKIFVANTSTTEKELAPYYKLAETHKYRVISIIVENRHGGQNIHNVPEETIEKMTERFSIKL